MPLREALQTCRQVHDLGPFMFNNGNTFAAVGRTMVEELLQRVPPVEAQILRTTIGHFIVGLIDKRELLQVLRHLEPLLTTDSSPAPAPAPVPVSTPPPV